MEIKAIHQTIHYTVEAIIPKEDVERWNKLLSIDDEIDYEKEGIRPMECVAMWTIRFPDGHFIDIKVISNCLNEPLFAEAVLFDKDGNQIECTDNPEYDIDGTWNLGGGNGITYSVEIIKGE